MRARIKRAAPAYMARRLRGGAVFTREWSEIPADADVNAVLSDGWLETDGGTDGEADTGGANEKRGGKNARPLKTGGADYTARQPPGTLPVSADGEVNTALIESELSSASAVVRSYISGYEYDAEAPPEILRTLVSDIARRRLSETSGGEGDPVKERFEQAMKMLERFRKKEIVPPGMSIKTEAADADADGDTDINDAVADAVKETVNPLEGKEEFLGALRKAAGAVKDPKLWRDIAQALKLQTRRRIAAEKTDPEGTKWKELSHKTQTAKAKRSSGGILEDSGALFESIEGFVLNAGAGVGTPVNYGLYHQTGTGRMPARPFLGLSGKDTGEIFDILTQAYERIL
ncbi:hypothetical protein CHS0354_006814 [Potamilus streckersoni]|uniref:Phage virion morphogenesis protein n=1 Tax=Potamilus streckersoni TaxID=2493646 RepID=A0AAE0WB39_9BIVA|nr:hypothetical protein CHS0354_006814 [Potamilus streckersoni]